MPVPMFRWTVATAMVALLMLPAAAAADDLIVIPVSGFARGDEGDVVTIATVDVPAETVGATCQITGITVNQVSVHEGNDLLIITNGQTFIVPDFEDAGFIEHEAGEVAAVGSTIQLQIRFGPDGVSSGGFRVSVDCDPANFPTTTVVEPTTTTEAPTTETTAEEPPAGPTTEPVTTVPTTDAPSTSVVALPPSTATPTSEAPPAGPTTEAEPTTTTAIPTTAVPATAAPTTEVPPAGPEADDDGSLPVTGSSTGLILSFGAVFVAAGVVLRRFASVAA